jgi:hypothetical protein
MTYDSETPAKFKVRPQQLSKHQSVPSVIEAMR